MTLKQKIYNHYLQLINDKMQSLQIEQANVRGQLKDAATQKTALEKINPILSAPIIVNGSLVKTNRGYFFLSVALAKAIIEGNRVMAISPQSPLGIQLMGLKAGGTAAINANKYIIESIE